jgi:hypothetical protein
LPCHGRCRKDRTDETRTTSNLWICILGRELIDMIHSVSRTSLTIRSRGSITFNRSSKNVVTCRDSRSPTYSVLKVHGRGKYHGNRRIQNFRRENLDAQLVVERSVGWKHRNTHGMTEVSVSPTFSSYTFALFSPSLYPRVCIRKLVRKRLHARACDQDINARADDVSA